MFNFKKSVSMLFIISGICGLFFATKTQAEIGNPDLTVTDIIFSGSQQGETGKLAVTIKNLGGDLNNTAGLLNTYNNFSSQNFVFDSSTPSATQFKTDRALPDPSTNNPLKTNETITLYWYGSFNTSGNLYLQYTVDNANELMETNDNNNTLSKVIQVGNKITENITISNMQVADSTIRPDRATVTWVTDVNTNSIVYYVEVGKTNWSWQGVDSLSTNHSVLIPYLKAFTTYQYQVVAKDANGNITRSDTKEFTTTAGSSVVTTNFTNQAVSLSDNKIGQLLAEINSLRNTISEQANQIKYLNNLVKGTNISTDAQSTLNNFITYGSDVNTKKLGAGERAAVIYSYKNAFDKLPTTETELTDAIKIANGRWPSITSQDAEDKAKKQFQKIYKRAADMNKSNDNAAVTVMAYGLRQKAENRNLNSEASGIKTFKAIYGRTPSSTEDWNIMQAITYSGASR